MQLHTLDQLQARLDTMLERLQQLKDEKAQLVNRNLELEAQLQETQQRIESLPSTDHIEALERENGELRTRQDDIKNRVESMLTRLEAVQ